MSNGKAMSGTAYSKIHEALSGFHAYAAFRLGKISVSAYQKWVEREGKALASSLNEDQVNLSARFPSCNEEFVRRALAQCRALDIIADDRYYQESAQKCLVDIEANWHHKGHLTYIFPEETLLMFSLVRTVRPSRAAFMGSYYGYWAIAAKIANPELEMTLLDVNHSVMGLAQENFELLNLAHGMSFIVGDAEQVASTMGNIDLLILDAEGPKSFDVPEDYRDKAIYYPHLKAGLKILNTGGLVIAHNVILSNFTGGTYWEGKQDSYRQQYKKFLRLLSETCIFTVIDSTEGTLVARKRADRITNGTNGLDL